MFFNNRKNTKVNFVPDKIRAEFEQALIHANKKEIFRLIKKYKIDCNGFIDNENNNPILQKALTVLNQYRDTPDQLTIINYLLENGANPNIKNREGYNSLHVSLSDHSLSKVSLLLIEKGNIDVNAQDENGNNLIFIAIREYGKTWRPDQKNINDLRYQIIEKLLNKGADLDLLNNHGINSRRWLEISNDQKLKALIKNFDQ
ncbi:hypothetical protein OO013_16620 [Mangrovivirga sp. M17]|uniref:Ankyrin repeat domain-containing protein n=1 Tax=Mangrovivirga halotolerans TaxID=2993936 RepID=A0ABT3RVE8_9BACT|nr:ankyrin repeat domain-containing protein [Mangrovivirga halotolerans]MCX2745506.1 hypothetical protein [Mangrovivirga halotolerans]